jgi:hypothetical protein
MMEGSGTLVIEATSAPGAARAIRRVFHDSGTDYLVFHAYDANDGRSICKSRRWCGKTAGREWRRCRTTARKALDVCYES